MSYQAPRGTNDILPNEIAKWHKVEEVIQQFTYLYNYKEIRTPIFEHTEVFKRGNDSSDMVNKEMYTFEDNGKRQLTLRPEGTAGVARAFVEHKLFAAQDLPQKLYYIGPQFRYERPQKGRQRIFHQFGVEAIGAKNPIVDVETIALGWSIVQSLGLSDLKVLINTLGDDVSRTAYRAALQDHFKEHLPTMCKDCERRFDQNPLRILDCKVDAEHDALKSVPNLHDYLSVESKEYFTQVLSLLDELDIPYELDNQLVRGLDYYTHTVFEVVSINKNMGSQSTVFAGGRYDGLVEYFNGPSMSGIGFAMGIERLLLACEGEGVQLVEKPSIDAYVLCLDKSVSTTAFQLLTVLRHSGFVSEMDYLQRSFKAQFKSVERMNTKVVILIGEQEVSVGTVKLKRISDQKQIEVKIEDMVEAMDALLKLEEDCSCETCDKGEEHEQNT